MLSPYRIKTVPCESGERFPLMINRDDGMPLFYPCVYTTILRGENKQDATLKKHVGAIKFLYDWCLKNRIDIETRFKAGEFLTLGEIDSLAQDSFTKANSLLSDFIPDDVAKPRKRTKVAYLESFRSKLKNNESLTVNSDTAGTRLWYMRDYLHWLASKKISKTNMRHPDYRILVTTREMMKEYLAERIPEQSEQGDPKMGMEHRTEKRLLEVINPDSSENPWRDKRVRVRNRLYIYMLLLLGIRRSEALVIETGDINFSNNTVTIHRSPDDKNDPRLHQPQTKTLARRLSMSPELSYLCREYMMDYRCLDVPSTVWDKDYLFVETKNGLPMTIATADAIFKTIRKKVPDLPKEITPHIMRHTWNDRFSEQADENIRTGVWKIADEESTRKEQMGWRLRSQMAERYSKRHIRAKADEVSMKLQNKIINGGAARNDSEK